MELINNGSLNLKESVPRNDDSCPSLDWTWRSCSDGVPESSILVHGEKVVFHPTYSSGTAAVVGDNTFSRPHHHFWEVQFTSPVYGTDVMVGLATRKLDLASHCHSFASFLGHDSASWGYSYHGYTQHAGTKVRFGSKWGRGDVVGVHLDTWRGHVYFYHNGKLQGLAFTGLQGLDLIPIVCSTAAKSEIKLVTARSFPNTLQFECFRRLSQKLPRSDLLDIHLPPGLRNFVLNNYWFLDLTGPYNDFYYETSPVKVLTEAMTNSRKVPNRCAKNKRDYAEELSTDEDEDNECFLNIKSKKLALMRKCKANLQTSSAPCLSPSVTESPACSSQDVRFRRTDSEVAVMFSKRSENSEDKNDEVDGETKTSCDNKSDGSATPKVRKRFVLSRKNK